jgi:hypothetical protein
MATQLQWLQDGYKKLKIFSIPPRSTVQPAECVNLVCQKLRLGVWICVLWGLRTLYFPHLTFNITESIITSTLCLSLTLILDSAGMGLAWVRRNCPVPVVLYCYLCTLCKKRREFRYLWIVEQPIDLCCAGWHISTPELTATIPSRFRYNAECYFCIVKS